MPGRLVVTGTLRTEERLRMSFRNNPRGRLRVRDTKVLVVATYDNGRTAYFRVLPVDAEGGNASLMPLARAAQQSGELPEGTIAGLRRVR